MILRRLYSSIPSPGATSPAALSHPIPTSRPQTRGRIRPRLALPKPSPRSRHSTTIAKPIRLVGAGRGRKPRYSWIQSRSDVVGSSYPLVPEPQAVEGSIPCTPRLSFTHPVPASNHVNDFQPIYIYPEQFKLHNAFTHPSHPLPLYLGTKIYTQPPASSSSEQDIFTAPTSKLRKIKDGGTLAEHLTVAGFVSAEFASETDLEVSEMEFPSVTTLFENRAASLKASNSEEWENTLAILEGKRNEKIELIEKKDANLEEVVADLSQVLAQMDMNEEIGMDSVRRKRRKKISKHKHKKRRKATRALRKKLGK
ncbi:hypothetical protein L204_104703 [Cryptococcus depauperatus]|nr:hypothetical protein L204_03574 [Cryptococcus depauperatus CBS 7855]